MAETGLILGGRYQLRTRIGSGGMGDVWWGTDLALRRVVAVKLIRPDRARDEEGRARFRAESRHAAALAHPNIVRVYDYCEDEPSGLDYLVMEFVDGPCVARLLDDGPLDAARTMNVVAQAARGLQAAHEAGVVHRDIKPANLLVSRDGRVAIADFGIAYATGSIPVTRAGIVMGTPAYLAPERVSGVPATPASDLYALGVVAYECLTGKIPFDGQPLEVAAAHIEAQMPPLASSVPAEVARLVADLTARDPAARPAGAAEVAARAEGLRAALSRPIRPAGPVRTIRPRRPAAGVIFPARQRTVTLRLPAPGPAAQDRPAGQDAKDRSAGQDRSDGRAGGVRIPRGLARTVLPVGGLAVAGLVGWVLATTPGPGPAAHQPSAAPAATAPAAGSPTAPGGPPTAGRHPADNTGRRDTGQAGAQVGAQAGAAGPAAATPSGAAAAAPPGLAAPAAAAPAQPLPPGQAKRVARGLPAQAPKAD